MDSPDRPSAPPHLLAEITLLPTDRGGRAHPLRSPARLTVYFDGREWTAAGFLRDQTFVYPGRSAWIELHLEDWSSAVERVYPGKPFLIREQEQVIAYGLVKRILPEEAPGEAVEAPGEAEVEPGEAEVEPGEAVEDEPSAGEGDERDRTGRPTSAPAPFPRPPKRRPGAAAEGEATAES